MKVCLMEAVNLAGTGTGGTGAGGSGSGGVTLVRGGVTLVTISSVDFTVIVLFVGWVTLL
jgi:hypothetical protein